MGTLLEGIGPFRQPVFRRCWLTAVLSGLLACSAVCAGTLPVMGSAVDAAAASADPSTAPGGTFLNDDQRVWLHQQPTVRVGVTGIPPQVFSDEPAGTLSGLCIDYLRHIETLLGVSFDIIYYDTWDELMNAGFARQVDVVYAAQQTPARRDAFLFTQPYLEFSNKIVTTTDERGSVSMADLAGKRVAVVKGAATEEYLQSAWPQIQRVPVNDELTGLLRVSFGEADAMIIEVSRASWYIRQDKITNLRIAGDAGYPYRLGFACRSDWPPLREILDAALSQIAPPQRRQLEARWTFPLAAKAVDWRILYGVPIGIAVLLLGVLLWNILLRRSVKARTFQLQQELAERKKAEQALLMTQFAIDHAGESVFLINHEAGFEYVNQSACRSLGYTQDELLTMRVGDIDPDFDLQVWSSIWESTTTNKVGRIERRHRRKDGHLFPVEITANYMYYEGRELHCVFVRDISARKAAERMLRFTQFAVDHAGEDIFWTGSDGRFVYVNEKACQTLGYTRDELLTMTVPEIDPGMPPDAWAAHWEEMKRERFRCFDMFHKTKDGRSFPVEISATFLDYDGSGYICAIVRDISERQTAEAARQKLMRELRSKNEELESIVFIASHDLRSPLVNVRGFTGELEKSLTRLQEVLAGETLSETTRRALDDLFNGDIAESMGFIKAGNHKMDLLLNGLLRLIRIGTAEVFPTELDMQNLFAGVIHNVRFRTRQADIEITVDEPIAPCRGDAVLLAQVFNNLIENAIKYRSTDRPARIHISAETTGATVIYCVTDNGIGIAPEHVDKVFEIFHRLAPDSGQTGEGLGLTIVRRVLERQDGRVWIDSTPGVGTAVYVELPKAAAPDP